MSKPTSAPWLDLARGDLGRREIKGGRHNPEILQCFADCGHPEIEADEVAWCAAQMGSWLKRAGYPIPPRAHNLMARSYLTYGKRLDTPRVGCIGVFGRGKPPFGHVGVVTGVDLLQGRVLVIGGNQGDAVSQQWFQIAHGLPGGWRWPVAATVEDLAAAGSTEILSAERGRTLIALGTGATALAKGAQDVAQPDTSAWLPVSMENAADQAGQVRILTEAADAVARLVAGNLWIVVAGLVAGLVYWQLGRQQRARVARAALGAPLSAEIAAADAMEMEDENALA